LTKSDPFLVEGFLSEPELAVVLDHWRRARFPEEYDRFKRLEANAAYLEQTGRLLESYQRSCANQAIIAGSALPARPNPTGAPGPARQIAGRQ
jgi:hypothetical protein